MRAGSCVVDGRPSPLSCMVSATNRLLLQQTDALVEERWLSVSVKRKRYVVKICNRGDSSAGKPLDLYFLCTHAPTPQQRAGSQVLPLSRHVRGVQTLLVHVPGNRPGEGLSARNTSASVDMQDF